MKSWINLLFLLIVLSSCGGEVAVPKPSVYPRIFYPEKEYDSVNVILPYAFEKPKYANLEPSRDGRRTTNPDAKYWRNLDFPSFDATLHLSYSTLNNIAHLDSLKEEARRLTYEHAFRADDIQQILLNQKEKNVFGTVYLIEGNTATNLNFYLTDSSKHFFRGSLYFNQKTKPDSILPVFSFIKADVEHLIETFRWSK